MEQICIDFKRDLNKIRDFGLVRGPLGPPGKAISLIFLRDNTDFSHFGLINLRGLRVPFGGPLGGLLGGHFG